MDTGYYLHKFQQIVDALDKQAFEQHQLKLRVGIWMDSAVLKIQNPAWLNQSPQAKPFGESIFFSVWVSDETIRQGKIYYNIHALKLRELTGYKIKSRDFAEAFRDEFKALEQPWPNVSINFGPLTLMEGWLELDEVNSGKSIAQLTTQFISVAVIIDQLLNERKN
jgi:hypothetical protein